VARCGQQLAWPDAANKAAYQKVQNYIEQKRYFQEHIRDYTLSSSEWQSRREQSMGSAAAGAEATADATKTAAEKVKAALGATGEGGEGATPATNAAGGTFATPPAAVAEDAATQLATAAATVVADLDNALKAKAHGDNSGFNYWMRKHGDDMRKLNRLNGAPAPHGPAYNVPSGPYNAEPNAGMYGIAGLQAQIDASSAVASAPHSQAALERIAAANAAAAEAGAKAAKHAAEVRKGAASELLHDAKDAKTKSAEARVDKALDRLFGVDSRHGDQDDLKSAIIGGDMGRVQDIINRGKRMGRVAGVAGGANDPYSQMVQAIEHQKAGPGLQHVLQFLSTMEDRTLERLADALRKGYRP
jgi:hypothetical protein